MKRKTLLVLLALILVVVPVFVSCTSTTSTANQTGTSTVSSAAQSTFTTSTKPASTSVSTTTSPAAHWWDKFGEPEYGGELVMRASDMDPSFDSSSFINLSDDWWEQLFVPDWTLDRNVWSYQFGNFVPEEYMVGGLAEKWSWTDSTTLAITIHQGIKWQNKPPVNGREFTADDIVFTFDRLMGTGHGYTTPNEAYTRFVEPIEKVTLIGTYSFTIKFKNATPWSNMRAIYESIIQPYEAPEVVALGAHVSNPELAIGTGPYMFSEITRNSQMTLVANPDYWRNDERFPDNKLPYIQKLKKIVIGDDATATAALRTGKIDFMGQQSLQSKNTIVKSDPDIIILTTPDNSAAAEMRVDLKPFSDIRVRKALQLAVDISSIAKNYYQGTVLAQPCGDIHPNENGYSYPYSKWSQSLKDEYTYNPTQAKALLAEAGYADGFKTNMVFNSDQSDLAFLQILQSMFIDIGVNMELIPMDRVTFDNYTSSGKHDGLISGNAGTTRPPQICISTRIKGAVGNTEFIDDPVIQDLFNKISAATGPDVAKQICQEYDKQLITQHYIIVGPVSQSYAFSQPYLKGFSGEVSPGRTGAQVLAPYFYAARVWIDQDMKK